MSDYLEENLKAKFELANEISRVKQELINIAISEKKIVNYPKLSQATLDADNPGKLRGATAQ